MLKVQWKLVLLVGVPAAMALTMLANCLRAHDGHSHADSGTHIDWRSTLRCGPNSLYVLLRMTGRKPDYRHLLQTMEMGDRGVSVAELARAAKGQGLSLTALRIDSHRLLDTPLPAIVHMNDTDTGFGHFLVWTEYLPESEGFVVADCTYGDIRLMSRGDFQSQWSGVVLVAADRWSASNRWLFVAVLLTAFNGCLLLCYGRTVVPRRWYTSKRP
jgi:Peptidase C39 family